MMTLYRTTEKDTHSFSNQIEKTKKEYIYL